MTNSLFVTSFFLFYLLILQSEFSLRLEHISNLSVKQTVNAKDKY